MKFIIALLVLLLGIVQYELLFASGGLLSAYHLRQEMIYQSQQYQAKHQRNNILWSDIKDLKIGRQAIAAHARYDLGMIKPGEVFYQIVDAGD